MEENRIILDKDNFDKVLELLKEHCNYNCNGCRTLKECNIYEAIEYLNAGVITKDIIPEGLVL